MQQFPSDQKAQGEQEHEAKKPVEALAPGAREQAAKRSQEVLDQHHCGVSASQERGASDPTTQAHRDA